MVCVKYLEKRGGLIREIEKGGGSLKGLGIGKILMSPLRFHKSQELQFDVQLKWTNGAR